MKITLRNSVRPSMCEVRELDIDERHGLAFIDSADAIGICVGLFGLHMGHGLSGIDATDDDGRAYLVLLR